MCFFFSSRRRHSRCALVTGVQTCALPIYARAERSLFTGKPAPVVGIRKLATEALERLGKAVTVSSQRQAYNSGQTTQVPTGRTLAVKDRVRRRIGYDEIGRAHV